MADETIDCRSQEGVTIGLIDSIISIARVLAPRLSADQTTQVTEALADLRGDSDLRIITQNSEDLRG